MFIVNQLYLHYVLFRDLRLKKFGDSDTIFVVCGFEIKFEILWEQSNQTRCFLGQLRVFALLVYTQES